MAPVPCLASSLEPSDVIVADIEGMCGFTKVASRPLNFLR